MERKEKVKYISTLLDRVLIWCYTIYRTKEQRRPLGLMNSNDPKSGIAPLPMVGGISVATVETALLRWLHPSVPMLKNIFF